MREPAGQAKDCRCMRALLFHNPKAGDGSHSRKTLQAKLRKAGFSVTYCSTKSADFPEMLQESADLFVVAGGDGTVGKVLKRMPDRSVPVAIIPVGTANNIARSLGITEASTDVVAGLRAARKQKFDIGLACGPWGQKLFVEAAGLGALTDSMVRIDAVKIERGDGIKLGRDKFRKALGEARPIRLGLSVDGHAREVELLMVEILNIPFAGPSLGLAPQAGLGDGLFDIVSIAPEQRTAMLAWLGTSQPHAPPPVSVQQGRAIDLTWEGSQLRLDDDCPSRSKHGDKITVKLDGEAVTILVPEAADGEPAKAGRTKRSEAT